MDNMTSFTKYGKEGYKKNHIYDASKMTWQTWKHFYLCTSNANCRNLLGMMGFGIDRTISHDTDSLILKQK